MDPACGATVPAVAELIAEPSLHSLNQNGPVLPGTYPYEYRCFCKATDYLPIASASHQVEVPCSRELQWQEADLCGE